MSTNLNTKR